MVENIKLKDIYFGEVEGKDEASENKEILNEIFYSGNNTYEEIKKNKKFLIIGRKGTGKTILAEYFKSKCDEENAAGINEYKKICKILDDNDFMMKKLTQFDYDDINEEEMATFWRWVFLAEIGNLIIKETKQYKIIFKKNYRKLLKIVTKYGYKIDNYSESETTSVSGSLGTKLIAALSTNQSSETKKNFVRKKYFENIDELESIIFKVLKVEKLEFHLFYDDLDELETTIKANNNPIKFVHAMVKSAKKLNSDIFDAENNSKVNILMRKDMVHDIQNNSNNFNKIVVTNGVELDWQYNSAVPIHSIPIAAMIIKKIRISSEEFTDDAASRIYNRIFPKFVDRKRNAIKYLIENGFGRPRDVVMFLNTVKENNLHEKRITPNMMINCLPAYSTKFWNELKNEINRHGDSEKLFDCIKLIKDNGFMVFTVEEIIGKYNLNESRYQYLEDEDQIKDVLTILYTYSIIGTKKNLKTSNRNKSSGIIEFYYRDNENADPNFDDQLVVHYGLINALSVSKQTKNKSA